MQDPDWMNRELDQFPLTGRFLMGRLRHAMKPAEKRGIESLVEETHELAPGTTILRRGELVTRSAILIEGMVLRVVQDEGRRFAVGIQVAGDFVDLHGFALRRLDHDLVSVGAARIGVVSHDRLATTLERNLHLARILWFSTLLDAAIHREWIMKLEQLTAARRAAHLFAELWHRLRLVGLGGREGFRTALNQIDLADICGTSAVNMSRALSRLKAEGVARFHRGQMTAPDRAALERYGRFNADYLYGSGGLKVGDELSR